MTVANIKTPARPCNIAAVSTRRDDLKASLLRRTSKEAITAKNAVIKESVDSVCTQRSQLFVIHEHRRRISGEKSLKTFLS